MAAIDKTTLVSSTELGAVLGLTARRIQQLSQDGIFTAQARGKYNLALCVQQYIAQHLRKIEEKYGGNLPLKKMEEEIRLKKAKADMAEMERDEWQGKMHRSEDVRDMTSDLLYTIRHIMLALPGRLAMDAVQCQSAAEASDLIRREVSDAMAELSNYEYDPEKYREKVRERMKWEQTPEIEEEEE